MDKQNTLNPIISVKIARRDLEESVEVQELTWKDFLRAIKQLSAALLEVLDAKGGFALTKDNLVKAITESEDLMSWVIHKSCPGKDQAWVDGLTSSHVLPIIEAIITLNASEEAIGSGKKLADLIKKTMGTGQKEISTEPLDTSSKSASV